MWELARWRNRLEAKGRRSGENSKGAEKPLSVSYQAPHRGPQSSPHGGRSVRPWADCHAVSSSSPLLLQETGVRACGAFWSPGSSAGFLLEPEGIRTGLSRFGMNSHYSVYVTETGPARPSFALHTAPGGGQDSFRHQTPGRVSWPPPCRCWSTGRVGGGGCCSGGAGGVT